MHKKRTSIVAPYEGCSHRYSVLSAISPFDIIHVKDLYNLDGLSKVIDNAIFQYGSLSNLWRTIYGAAKATVKRDTDNKASTSNAVDSAESLKNVSPPDVKGYTSCYSSSHHSSSSFVANSAIPTPFFASHPGACQNRNPASAVANRIFASHLSKRCRLKYIFGGIFNDGCQLKRLSNIRRTSQVIDFKISSKLSKDEIGWVDMEFQDEDETTWSLYLSSGEPSQRNPYRDQYPVYALRLRTKLTG